MVYLSSEILTTEDVANYLRVSERTVYEWAQKGEIPAGKIGTAWRFKKNDIENWVDEKLASPKTASGKMHKIAIESFLSPDRIILLDYAARHDVLVKLAEVLATAPQIKNAEELSHSILKRESLMSTAIGRGVAIPHVRLPSVTDLVMAVGLSKKDILDFDAADGQPVRLVFMIAAAANQHSYYLQTIAYLSSKLRNDSIKTKLMEAKDPAAVYSILCG